MSDFYDRRRVAIKDATALLTFFLGYVFAAAFAWPLLKEQLDRGDIVRGLGFILAAALVTGVISGGLGLELGTALGCAWERYHRSRRAARAR